MGSQLKILISIFFTVLIFGCTNNGSDESILRTEFNVPRNAKMISYQAHPEQNAWLREGLNIDIVFQLSDQDYNTYVADAEKGGSWQPLPIPAKFLRRMGAIESRLEANKARIGRSENKVIPEPGSIYNPTEAQLLAKFIASLPDIPKVGLFQCRSAGDNIMRAPKTIHTQLNYDLNDFMLAMLDDQRKQIVIQVNTSY